MWSETRSPGKEVQRGCSADPQPRVIRSGLLDVEDFTAAVVQLRARCG